MFGGGSNSAAAKSDNAVTDSAKSDKKPPSPESKAESGPAVSQDKSIDQTATPSGEKRSGNGSPPGRQNADNSSTEKKRRGSGVGSKASSFIASAKNTLNFGQGGKTASDPSTQTPLQKLGKQDQSLAVPQGQHNNSAGDSAPGPRSTFRVGVWEDRNKKCRRTMEDTHAFLYNFLHTPAPHLVSDSSNKSLRSQKSSDTDAQTETSSQDMAETDNGYFAIFDGHAGTFAADWCGKKLHLILEDVVRRSPNVPLPELLDETFTKVDAQLEKLPVKNSGCTAAIAVLRWEDRVPSSNSLTGSQALAAAAAAASKASEASKSKDSKSEDDGNSTAIPESAHARLKGSAVRQRVLYTANVGDARIILCRNGRALRLSYDHKGSDENEGKRIANAGGLILNNRVNGVLAVTRALGDTYMKHLVTGHPYTTETVIQPDSDEFLIIACDGLWDVCSDQEAVDLVRDIPDPVAASKLLVDHALTRFSTDNLSCMIVRFDKTAVSEQQKDKDRSIGVEGDKSSGRGKLSEAEKIVSSTKQDIAKGENQAVGISGSNNGRGFDPKTGDDGDGFTPTIINGPVEEEPASLDDSEPPELNADALPKPKAPISTDDKSADGTERNSKAAS
ncbi:PP2C-domain-containing protein [Xylariaceae sp. FL0804]|nr:PP2C-domain-containing protein [Xylariaceae sp. FL0804]